MEDAPRRGLRIGWSVAMALTAIFLIVTAVEFYAVVTGAIRRDLLGGDLTVLLAVAQRWLDTGVLYSPSQFDGPYVNDNAWLPKGVAFLYPPVAVLFFASYLFLPAILWWAIPTGIVLWGLWYWRPAWWSWPIMAVSLVPLQFSAGVAVGNTMIWGMAAVTLATRWPAAAAMLALKPTFLVFALPFVRKRSLWIGLAVVATVSLPFGEQWFRWIGAIGNLSNGGILYSWPAYPMTAIPLIAWWASERTALGPHIIKRLGMKVGVGAAKLLRPNDDDASL